jgi:hypothetical protein
LGLPPDTLSASIISFARYFSLPLNPDLLAKIRREALFPAPGKNAAGEPVPGKEAPVSKAAAALAAAAAASKGVGLSLRGLETYALSLRGQEAADPEYPAKEPEAPERPLGGDGNSGGGGGGGERRERTDGEGPAASGKTRRTGRVLAAAAADADKLREQLIKIEEQDPLLHLLNRLPGKNGRRWIVIPFSLPGETGEFRVSLRLLLRETPSGGSPDRLALDVSGGDQNPLRWLFVFDKPPEGDPRLQVRFWPPEDKKTLNSFRKELSRLFSMGRKQIILRNYEEFPPFATDCRDNVLLSVNEEV